MCCIDRLNPPAKAVNRLSEIAAAKPTFKGMRQVARSWSGVSSARLRRNTNSVARPPHQPEGELRLFRHK
jgi:hypothetical protein